MEGFINYYPKRPRHFILWHEVWFNQASVFHYKVIPESVSLTFRAQQPSGRFYGQYPVDLRLT